MNVRNRMLVASGLVACLLFSWFVLEPILDSKTASAQEKKGKGVPLPKPQQPAPKVEKAPKGEVTLPSKAAKEVQAKSLTKFKTEVVTPPAHKPAPRPGGSWHWHRWHGWLWFPVAVAPPAVLIPESYALPATVIHYQMEAVPLRIICPHCGQPIFVYIR